MKKSLTKKSRSELHPAVKVVNAVVVPRVQGLAPNTFVLGGLGSVLGFLIAGPIGAAVVGGLGAYVGGKTDESNKK